MFFILYPITRYFTQLTACAVRCTLPGKCPPMQAWRPLSRRIAQKAVLSKMLERTAQNRVIFEAGAKKKKSRNPHGYWIFRWRSGWDSNPRAREGYLISSLLCNCDGGVRFGVVSVSPVPAESRLKSGFFARKALRDGLFWKWVQIGIFPDFGEKCGKIGEKNRETAIHRRIELPTDKNLFLRCYKWMYFPSTGTAFPR